jgi:hypothetical protein
MEGGARRRCHPPDRDSGNRAQSTSNYGYGQLYGVRISKVGTNCYMLCSYCPRGYELTKEQWQTALTISNELRRRTHVLADADVGRCAVRVANSLFPAVADFVSPHYGS